MEIERIDTRKLPKSACTSVTCADCTFAFNADRGYIWLKKEGGERVCYDCAKKYNVRKEKLEWHLPRKDLKKISSQHSKTIKCGVCEKRFVTPQGKGYHWHLLVRDPPKRLPKPYEYDVCYECAEAKILYRQQYGFWLRGFVSEHFIPCEKCQDRLHAILFEASSWNTTCPPIELTVKFVDKEKKERVGFALKFVWKYMTIREGGWTPTFYPCKKCAEKLKTTLLEKELHIGSEVKPPVELWRRMNQVAPELPIPVTANFKTDKSQILDVKKASKDGELPSPESE